MPESKEHDTTVTVIPNANYHSVTWGTVFDARRGSPEFQEYRRRWLDYPREFQVGPFPIHLDIESTGVCNLRCPFCASTTKNWGPKGSGYIDMELYRRIIDEGVENGLCSIKLSFRGEPLLHPDLPQMVSYAKDRGILDVYFNTNATLLTHRRINELIDSGLDRISVSFEGTTKDVYESCRVGAKYEQVIDNIRTLRRARDARQNPFPQIRVQTVLLPELTESFPEYVEFWRPIADEVAYLDGRYETPEADHRGLVAGWACPMLWQRMTILWDGTLLPCLMHGVANFDLMSLGNVRDIRIKDAWLGEAEEHRRALHKAGRSHELEACDRCSYRAMELSKLEALES